MSGAWFLFPLLLLACLSPAFAVGAQSPHLHEERELLENLQDRFGTFARHLNEVENRAAILRDSLQDDDAEDVERMTHDLSINSNLLTKEWKVLNRDVAQALKDNPRLMRPGVRVTQREASVILAIHKYMQAGDGPPLEFLARSWRGLSFGKKVATVPRRLSTSYSYRGVDRAGREDAVLISTDDMLVVITPNGGVVRGVVEGWFPDERVVVHEALPLPLVRYQRSLGHFRIMRLSSAARVEVFRTPETVIRSSPSILNARGDYSLNLARKGYGRRLSFQPSDKELLSLLRSGRRPPFRGDPKIEPLNPEKNPQPYYADPLFLNCESRL